jgi:hypothetical protein
VHLAPAPRRLGLSMAGPSLPPPLCKLPMPLPAAGIRACKPNAQAIRNAAADVLYGEPPTPVTISLPRYGIEGVPQVAGLDVGWGQQLSMGPDPRFPHRFLLTRSLPPGTYQLKFVIDGRWGYAPNLPTRMDGDNQNNWVAVPYRNIDPAVQVLRSFIRACAPGREEGFWPGGPGRLPAVTLHARSTAGGSWQASRCPPTCPCRPPASEF